MPLPCMVLGRCCHVYSYLHVHRKQFTPDERDMHVQHAKDAAALRKLPHDEGGQCRYVFSKAALIEILVFRKADSTYARAVLEGIRDAGWIRSIRAGSCSCRQKLGV